MVDRTHLTSGRLAQRPSLRDGGPFVDRAARVRDGYVGGPAEGVLC